MITGLAENEVMGVHGVDGMGSNIFIPYPINMYVFVRSDIPYVHQSVQAGHAVAEYFIKHGKPEMWHNGTMVYLGVKDELELVQIQRQFDADKRPYASFMEPDWSERPQMTAICTVATNVTFSKYKLINMNSVVKVLKDRWN